MIRWRGFTLIELVVTVAIVGMLAVIVVPLAELTVQRGREAELRSALRQIRGAIDQYRRAVEDRRIARTADESGYPRRLEDLADGVDDVSSPDGARIYFLRRLPRDPFHPDPQAPAAASWGLRSYASPPDSPAPGGDVFDVRSLSDRVGLNGIPYRQW